MDFSSMSVEEMLSQCETSEESLGTQDGKEIIYSENGTKYEIELDAVYDPETGAVQVYSNGEELGQVTMSEGAIFPLENGLSIGMDTVVQMDPDKSEGYAEVLVFDCEN